MNQLQLQDRIDAHETWLKSGYKAGKTFSAIGLDFLGLDFSHRSLIGANLVECKFRYAVMQEVNLESINVSKSDFSGADLRGANLKRCDFRYVRFDKNTIFEGAYTEGMLVDEDTFACLPDYLDKDKMEIFRDNSLTIQLRYQNQADLALMRDIANTFVDLVQQKHTAILPVDMQNTEKTYVLTFRNLEEDKQVEIRRWWYDFGALIKDFIANPYLLERQESPTNHNAMLFKHSLQMMEMKFEQQKMFAEQQKYFLDIYSEELQTKRQENARLLEENALLRDNLLAQTDKIDAQTRTFADTLHGIAEQITATSERKLPAKRTVSLQIEGKNIPIDADSVVYAEVSDGLVHIYLNNGKSKRTDNSIGDLENLLQDANPRILRCHKQFILNVEYVDSFQNRQNVVDVKIKGYPEAQVVVSAQQKERFRKIMGV